MKVLLVGSDLEVAIERHYKRYLTGFGVEINHFPAPDIVFQFHSSSLFNKVLFKLGIYKKYGFVNRELIRIADVFQPDIIWVFKGLEIFPSTLKKLRNKFRLANFNPDHPFIIIASSNGNKNVKNSVGLYHLHFSYHSALIRKIQDDYKIPCVFLPFAYDRCELEYQPPNTISEILKLCFQANPDGWRVKKIKLLADAGIEVDVFGHSWRKTCLKNYKNVSLFPIASRKKFWLLNQEYRVQLNLFREYNNDSHNMRTFEIPAVGGIQLTPYSDEQASFFESGREIFFFSNDEEMIAVAKKLLGMKKEAADEIRKAARIRSNESPYSFEDRAMTVFKAFQKLMDLW
jgi:spore maturation protein CgeB